MRDEANYPDGGGIHPRPGAGRNRRLVVNYLFQLLNQLIRICEQLLLVPLFLVAWGAEVYKDWVVLWAIMVFVRQCSLGTETYFGNRFIELTARDDRRAFQREIRVALFCTLSIGIAELAVAALILFASDSLDMLATVAMSKETAYISLALMISPILFIYAQQVLLTIYRAKGEFARGECVFAIYALAQLTGVAVVLALKLPPMAAAACYLVAPLLLTIGIIVDLKFRYDDVVFGLRAPNPAELPRMTAQSLLFFTAPLSLALIQSGPVILFGALKVPALLVLSYTLTRTFTGLTRQGANQFAVGSGIEMARQYLRGEREACRRLYFATGRVVTGLVGLFGGFTIWAARPFISTWTHGVVTSDVTLVLCFLGGVFLAAPGQAALMLLNYTNDARTVAIAWCSQAGFGLILTAVLTPIFGVAAAAFSFAAAESIAIGIFGPLVVQKRCGFSAAEHWAASFGVGLAAFACSAITAKLAFELGLPGLKGLVLTAALWGLVAVPPFALFALPASRRKMLLSRLRGLVTG
jgi:O-antigen/teichoic acid export membrane protein